MKIEEPLRQGQFIKRYKRFFADIQLGAEVIVAHVPNTGSLKSCLFLGAPCVVSRTNNPARKLKATLHFLKTPTSWVGVNTSLANALVHEAWAEKRIVGWQDFAFAQREFKISKESRLDMVLAPDLSHFEQRKKLHHIEVKNVTFSEGQTAYFPDAVTTRGQKHLRDLMNLVDQGHGAEIVFVVQRHDCTAFAPADDIDPEYGKLLRQAVKHGVTVRAFACEIEPTYGVTLRSEPLTILLPSKLGNL